MSGAEDFDSWPQIATLPDGAPIRANLRDGIIRARSFRDGSIIPPWDYLVDYQDALLSEKFAALGIKTLALRK